MRKIVRAIQKRKDEAIITTHGKIAVFLRYAFPGLIFALMARFRVKPK